MEFKTKKGEVTLKRKSGLETKREGTPGFEPGTVRTAAECSTTELYTLQ